MSTIKSSAENLTLNADGSGNDVIIQSNGSTKAIITAEGTIGIGTTSPQTIISLDENTDAIIGLNRETSGGNGGDLQIRAGAGRGSGNSGGDLYLCSGTGTSSAGVGKIQLGRSSGDDSTMPPDEIWATIDSDGLKFNTDTASANALDDYEEGTWTASFHNGTLSGGNTTGYYTKVGNLVNVTYYSAAMTISNTGGSARVSGLPYAINPLSSHYAAVTYTHGNAVTGVNSWYLDVSNTNMYAVTADTTASHDWQSGGGKYMMLTVTYRTT